MTDVEFAIRAKRVLVGGAFKQAAVLVSGGKIAHIVGYDDVPEGCKIDTVEDDGVLMPGLVDSHVHVNEPGRTEWEGFKTATRAAAAGGVTTIVDMPLNCIPVTTSLEAFNEKLAAIDGLLHVDCAFYGGVVPGNTKELAPMVEAGVVGFKCFLIHSGIDDFPNVIEDDLKEAMPELARLGVPLLVHAELDCGKHAHRAKHLSDNPRSYRAYLDSRPRVWENDAIKLMTGLCEKHDCRVHIVHLSSSDAVTTVKEALSRGLKFSAETCPHYLTFAAEDIPDGDTRYKCAPPIREQENSDRLWSALEDGTIQFIVSDHSPCTPELKLMKEGDFNKAWGGIASLQFGLPAVWTYAKKRGIALERVSDWMSNQPARFVGLDHVKGRIDNGFDADLIVFHPERSFVVEKSRVHHKHKETPHEGREFTGVVARTYVRGDKVYDDGTFAQKPTGKPLYRSRSGKAAAGVK